MIKIASWEDFVLKTKEKDVVYRGQAKNYPDIIPSLFRRTRPRNYSSLLSVATSFYMKAYHADGDYSKYLESIRQTIEVNEEEVGPCGTAMDPYPGHGFPSDEDFDEVGPLIDRLRGKDAEYRQALLQHYGVPSPTVDITYDFRVALWFAMHQLRLSNGGLARYYPNSDSGFVYIIRAPRENIVSLRGGRNIPIAGLRGERQQGGLLLGATAAAPTLTHFVIKTLEVLPSVFDSSNLNMTQLTQDFLFPQPEQDPFFKEILTARFSLDRTEKKLGEYFHVYI